jgi:hypothetical protein
MIDRTQLRTDLPPIIETKGYTNCVLACCKPEYYCESNTYLPCWQVANAVWYNEHAEDYLGWIELENVLPPEF